MRADAARARRAVALGTVTGARTFLAPAALALRGRIGSGRLGTAAKFALPALALGELVGDKLPAAPPRVEGPGLVGRVVTGGLVGRVSDGSRGLRIGAAFALASTYPSQALRAQIVKRTPLPDLACAIPEDLIGATVAALASTEPRPDPSSSVPPSPAPSQAGATAGVDGPKTPDMVDFSAHQPEAARGVVAAAGAGIAAAAVGTAAMTSAQYWVYGLFGGEASEAPAQVGERILGALGVKVKKEQRPALNAAMHVLYGTSWGLPFGVLRGRGDRGPGPVAGLAFGFTVWAASLAELPALGVAAPVWRQPATAIVRDLGFHLVYGLATAAALEALTA
jgi:uncharacterized membrane protein